MQAAASYVCSVLIIILEEYKQMINTSKQKWGADKKP